MSADALKIVPLSPEDAEAVVDLDLWAFPADPDVDGQTPAEVLAAFEWDRTFGGYLDDGAGPELAGVNTTWSMRMPVPGGLVDSAGLSWVGVHPQFRRRGILTRMIAHHLAEVRRRGEPFSTLTASEAAIYGRFGYGLATRHLQMEIGRGAATRPVPGQGDVRIRIESVDPDRHAGLVAGCYDRVHAGRPGLASRNAAHTRQMLADLPSMRRDSERLRIMVAETGGEVRGYALFRRKPIWADTPAGEVQVREHMATDAAAAAALWDRLLDLDLTATVRPGIRPLDDPLLLRLADPRSAKPRLVDGLYVRLVDLPAALAARRYAAPVDVVLDVTDALLPENAGRWRLTGGPAGATCTASADPAQLTLGVRELGSVYLGADSLAGLAAAGLVAAADPDALAAASTAFGWPVAAWCSWVY